MKKIPRLGLGWWIAVASLLVVSLWILWAILGAQIFNAIALAPEISREGAGQWGDTFGALNAIFSAAGAVAIIATLIMQGNAISAQARDQYYQRFESKYFALIGILREIRRETRFRYSDQYAEDAKLSLNKTQSDHDAFRAASFELRYWISRLSSEERDELDPIASIYRKFIFKRFEGNFAPYFRMIYTILNQIDKDSVLTKEEKIVFANIIRGQLTSHEVIAIGFNGLIKESKDLKNLLEKYRIFVYLPDNSRKKVLQGHYAAEAFLPRD